MEAGTIKFIVPPFGRLASLVNRGVGWMHVPMPIYMHMHVPMPVPIYVHYACADAWAYAYACADAYAYSRTIFWSRGLWDYIKVPWDYVYSPS